MPNIFRNGQRVDSTEQAVSLEPLDDSDLFILMPENGESTTRDGEVGSCNVKYTYLINSAITVEPLSDSDLFDLISLDNKVHVTGEDGTEERSNRAQDVKFINSAITVEPLNKSDLLVLTPNFSDSQVVQIKRSQVFEDPSINDVDSVTGTDAATSSNDQALQESDDTYNDTSWEEDSSATGRSNAGEAAWLKWNVAKLRQDVARVNITVREKQRIMEERIKRIEETARKKRREEETRLLWLRKKREEEIKKQDVNKKEGRMVSGYTRLPKTDEEREEIFKDWLLKKTLEMREHKAKLDKESRLKEEDRLKQEEENRRAFNVWFERSKNRPKPVPAGVYNDGEEQDDESTLTVCVLQNRPGDPERSVTPSLGDSLRNNLPATSEETVANCRLRWSLVQAPSSCGQVDPPKAEFDLCQNNCFTKHRGLNPRPLTIERQRRSYSVFRKCNYARDAFLSHKDVIVETWTQIMFV
uniref:Coiled-coil domain-containing protein n=1 Tax=Timema cristinae TaxID=61476 RepID=A0A7R9H8D0_TIMCR|nr:unnamed protein product [Timema cristinae]